MTVARKHDAGRPGATIQPGFGLHMARPATYRFRSRDPSAATTMATGGLRLPRTYPNPGARSSSTRPAVRQYAIATPRKA